VRQTQWAHQAPRIIIADDAEYGTPSGQGAEEGEDLLRACLILSLPKSPAFFLHFLIFFYQVLFIINYWEQRPCGALAMAKKKPHPQFLSTSAPGKKPSTQVPLV